MKDEKFKINSDLFPIFERLKGYFEEYSRHTLPDNHDIQKIFELVLKATVIKSYQFTLALINSRDNNTFFMIPALRGICEEYIVEKFIFDKFPDVDERGYIVQIWQEHEILKSSIAQWKYFQVNKSNQTLYYKETFNNELKEKEKWIKFFLRKKFPNATFKLSPFPSVHYMSKETRLLEFYHYLYHATSTFVHFHPQNLFRMGWGDFPEMQFSTTHFQHYYNDFALFYSALLFCELCQWQIENGYLNGMDKSHIERIKEILNGVRRWPEIVTFEEMNIGVLSRNLFFESPDMAVNEKSKEN